MGLFDSAPKIVTDINGTKLTIHLSTEQFHYTDSSTNDAVRVAKYDRRSFNRDIAFFNKIHSEELHIMNMTIEGVLTGKINEGELKKLLGDRAYEAYLAVKKSRDNQAIKELLELAKENYFKSTLSKYQYFVIYRNFRLYEISHNTSISKAIHDENKSPVINFNDFLFTVEKTITNIIIKHFSTPLGKVLLEGQKELKIGIYIFNSRVNSDTFEAFVDTMSSTDTLVLMFSGAFLLGNVYLPLKYVDKYNEELLKKESFGLLDYAVNHFCGVYQKEDYWRDEFQKFYKRRIPYYGRSLIILELFFQLFSYGKQNFLSNKINPFGYSADRIGYLRGLVDEISKSTDAKAQMIYDNKFSHNSDTGEFYLGQYMFFIIALEILYERSKKQAVKLIVDDQQLDLRDIPKYLKEHNNCVIENVHSERFTRQFINTNDPYFIDELNEVIKEINFFDEFLRVYENASKKLNIEPLFTSKSYDLLITQCFKKNKV